MLSVFADDSSDETQQRTVAVAGVIASDEEWNRLDRIWLERTGGIPFHATDCESDRGAYAGYCHLDNQNLYRDPLNLVGFCLRAAAPADSLTCAANAT
jgi:hypothetical protein